MNSQGEHTTTFIFNLALTLHTQARGENLSLAFVILRLLHITASRRFSYGARKKFLLHFSSSLLAKFFFTLQLKLLITRCNVITLRTEGKMKNCFCKMGKETINKKKRESARRKTSGSSNLLFLFSLSLYVFLISKALRIKRRRKKTISRFFKS